MTFWSTILKEHPLALACYILPIALILLLLSQGRRAWTIKFVRQFRCVKQYRLDEQHFERGFTLDFIELACIAIVASQPTVIKMTISSNTSRFKRSSGNVRNYFRMSLNSFDNILMLGILIIIFSFHVRFARIFCTG